MGINLPLLLLKIGTVYGNKQGEEKTLDTTRLNYFTEVGFLSQSRLSWRHSFVTAVRVHSVFFFIRSFNIFVTSLILKKIYETFKDRSIKFGNLLYKIVPCDAPQDHEFYTNKE
jgi:hypothetical protein